MGENIGDLGGLTAGARRLPALAERQAGAGDRRPDRRPALLPGLGAGLARQDPRRRAAPAAGHRPALARTDPRQRAVRNIDAWYAAFDVKPGDRTTSRPRIASGSGKRKQQFDQKRPPARWPFFVIALSFAPDAKSSGALLMTAAPQSDALVFFGATGDLAYKMIFPALQAMIKRGHPERAGDRRGQGRLDARPVARAGEEQPR